MVAHILKEYCYEQPQEYRFGDDAIGLAHWAANKWENKKARILDMGAGCGVIGLEWFAQVEGDDHFISFLEKQDHFALYLKNNIEQSSLKNYQVIMSCFSEYESESTFDCVLSNPPYFFIESGRLGPSLVKNTCRHIHEEKLKLWFSKAFEVLKEGGDFYFSFRHTDWLRPIEASWEAVDESPMMNCTLFHWRKKKLRI